MLLSLVAPITFICKNSELYESARFCLHANKLALITLIALLAQGNATFASSDNNIYLQK